MQRFILSIIATALLSIQGFSQIKVSSSLQSYDSILDGELIYYQFSWDDPIDEYAEIFPLKKPLKAFENIWDTMAVSDGLIVLKSSKNNNKFLMIDASGWDLMDKGYTDTVNYPNISPIIISNDSSAIEWRGFGFANELYELDSLPSTGNIILTLESNNKINITYGDFVIERPDLCFEGFGGLHPSITYIDENDSLTTWFIFGDPKSPSIDTLSDTAFISLPEIGQTISIDFNKTNYISRKNISKINVFPNPATENIKISGLSGSLFSYSIISINGKVVRKGILENNIIEINDLKQGNYIIKINDNKSVYFSKFIKI